MGFFSKMAIKTPIFIVLLFTILSVTTAAYVEALAAEAFDPTTSRVELRVALRQGYHNKYADIITGQWVTDMSAEYTDQPTEILEYCRQKYPNSEITNIVDSSQPVVIDQWCPVNGDECTGSAQVTYYRCLVGPFESDALMVYNVCKFYHKHVEKTCREPAYWKGVADKDCRGKKMAINSTGMLLPCETDKFRGVEYTCCPPPTYRLLPQVVDEVGLVEEEDDDDEDPVPGPERDNVDPTPQLTNSLLNDPYFARSGQAGSVEKKDYADAKSRLATSQKSKMARVMQQWQEAQEHYETLKAKDPEAAEKMRKEMTQRFEETIGAMEAENAEETEELREAHQVHIEVSLREKMNASYEAFRLTTEFGKPKTKKVLHALRRYLHAVQKARQHYIGHYKHIRQTDPLRAEEARRTTLRKLQDLDQEVADSVERVKSLPELYAELKPKVDALVASLQDDPEDTALIQTADDDDAAMATETPSSKLMKIEATAAEITDVVIDEEEEVEEEVEEQIEEWLPLEEEDTVPPAIAKTSETKTSTKSATTTQTEPEPPTPARDTTHEDHVQETEIELPVPMPKVPIVAVKPIESYLDEELSSPIETEADQPKTLIVAKKPSAKVQKSAAARVEKQKMVSRQDVHSIDDSVTKKRMVQHSEPMMAFGLACGVLAVATVLVIAVLIVRRKTRRTPINNGFTEIDPNLTVEQRHIVAMQQNGYENPTYKYFDMQ